MLALTMILVTTLVTGGHTDDPLPRRISGLRTEPAEGTIAIGGATLAAEAAEADLIDEYRARVYPVLVGGGIPFFPRRERRVELELVETRPVGPRVADLRHRVKRWPGIVSRNPHLPFRTPAAELKLSFPAGRPFEIRATTGTPLSRRPAPRARNFPSAEGFRMPRIGSSFRVFVTAAVLALAVGGAPPGAAAAENAAAAGTPSAGCGKNPTLTSGNRTIQSNGKTRSFILKIPDTYDNATPHRLAFGYHWLGGTADQVASGGSDGYA